MSLTIKAANKQSKTEGVPFLSTTVGAGVDSFYRSAMNSLLNARLTNKKAAFFPQMHIQIPLRIVYINGIKNLRFALDKQKKDFVSSSGWNPNLVGMGFAIVPGLAMTPFSSFLEATNAGHMNPEPLYRRWARGLIPRTVREVIFAIGLNQLSDICEEKVPESIENATARNVVGSLTAGVFAGYLSHVPHNLSTLKLLKPAESYGSLFQSLLDGNKPRVEKMFGSASQSTRTWLLAFMTVLTPKGVIIRTGQIMGSFIIVNGTINLFSTFASKKSTPEDAVYGAAAIVAAVPK